ncbi:TolC family protein [Puteibacter caeruleilacunae]|nr:TolC family protein [Puteibacter caeruleilacunae]
MIKYSIILAIALVLVGTSTKAQETLTLESAISLALENNLNIKVARKQADISANNATKGNAGLLPKLDASGGISYAQHTQDEVTSSAGVDLSYTLFDGFGRRFTYDILNLQKEQGALQARYNIESTISTVISAFYRLSETYDNVNTSSENVKISKERLQRNEAKYEFGGINKLDVLNAKVDFNRDSSNYLIAKQKYQEAIGDMNVYLGRPADTPFDLIPDASKFQTYNLEQMKEVTLQQNADYLLMAKEMEETEISLRKVKSSQLPSLNLRSGYTVYENEVAGSSSKGQLTGGISLSFNIFNGKQKKTDIANAHIQRDIALYNLENKQLSLEKDLINAYNDYQYNLKVLRLEEEALEAATLNFEQTKEYYQLGQVTSTTFREAQLNLTEARNNKAAARYQAKLSEVNLKKISGMLLN